MQGSPKLNVASVIDLAGVLPPVTEARTDVCVIGAGAAGLYLATRLAKQGRDVVLIEAGGSTCCSGPDIGISVAFSGREYRGASEGRAFGLGGSTSRWGGLVVPHSELDLRNETGPESETWQHVVKLVRARCAGVAASWALGRARTSFRFQTDISSRQPRRCGSAASRLSRRHYCRSAGGT